MSAGRRVTGVLGELLITAGVVVLLFVGYQLVWTNVQADRAADAKSDQLERDWEERTSADPEFDLPLPRGEASTNCVTATLSSSRPGLPGTRTRSPTSTSCNPRRWE